MSEEEIQLALSIFADATRDGLLDMSEAIEDDAMWERNRERFHPDAEIKFVIPESGGPEVMEQEYAGIEGLRTGWRAWLEPWDSYMITIDEVIDADEGGVVVLATSVAEMRATGMEVPQSAATRTLVTDGRVAAIHFYLDQQQAKHDAGLG